MTYSAIRTASAKHGLAILGGFHPSADETLLLFGPNPDFWAVLSASPEADHPDPVDRWSERVILLLAEQFNATPDVPFGGPPFAPFLQWALACGRCWSSPVGMLVHDQYGLMVSFRGAMTLPNRITLPALPGQSPCKTCATQPCRRACPVKALGKQGYDTARCHDFLDSSADQSCLSQGCAARRACPHSPKRPNAQSAHHMAYFHR